MKYIRTIDGRIFNKGKIICSAFAEEYISPNWNEDIEKYLQTKIIAEANTIEELCDCWDFFDSIYNEYKTREIYFYTLNNMKVSVERKYMRDVKLCIRTDKGLIYVAKMNNEGELELL